MKRRFGRRSFIYFLSVSFLLMMNGFPIISDAKEKGIPLGEMVSRGEVKYEARENVWKEVESFHFPIFQGTKIKTEKGAAIIVLSNNSQIEVGPSTAFSFDQGERFILSRGNIEFRIPPSAEINFRAGSLSILKSRVVQAAKKPSAFSPKDQDTMGSISIHSNGSVTVKSVQGNLSILNEDRVVLAGLSSKDSITIPSTTVAGPSRVMVAQAFPPDGKGLELLGLTSGWDYVAIGAGFGGFVTAVTLAGTSGGGKSGTNCFP